MADQLWLMTRTREEEGLHMLQVIVLNWLNSIKTWQILACVLLRCIQLQGNFAPCPCDQEHQEFPCTTLRAKPTDPHYRLVLPCSI